jgi:TetR/AcrR family transcriptional regulator, transcriptional repressor for nem operon
MKPRSGKKATRDRILDVAQCRIQSRGYNGFSFHDLAAELDLRTASIHYHFPTKAHLGVSLLQRYRQRFQRELETIGVTADDPARRLARFVALFERTFKTGNQLCLCGMLGAEAATLPPQVGDEVEAFFRETEFWLVRLLSTGRRAKRFAFEGTTLAQARLLLSVLEGGMVVARGMRSHAYFQKVARSYLSTLDAR